MSKDDKKKDNFFDDFIKLSSSAVNTAAHSLSDLKQSWEQSFNDKIDHFLASRNLVTREEFEVLKAMLEKANHKIDALEKELKTKKEPSPTKAKSSSAGTDPKVVINNKAAKPIIKSKTSAKK